MIVVTQYLFYNKKSSKLRNKNKDKLKLVEIFEIFLQIFQLVPKIITTTNTFLPIFT